MDRRQLLKSAGLALGVLVSPSCRQALESTADLYGQPVLGSLAEPQLQAIAALAELIIPATDTPGAIEAGVPAFIHQIVMDWYTEDERRIFTNGLVELDRAAELRWSDTFAELGSAQQAQLLRELEPPMEGLAESRSVSAGSLAPGASGELSFYVKLKELTVLGYYTSELAARTELDYQPVPGYYDGDARFDESQRQWTR